MDMKSLQRKTHVPTWVGRVEAKFCYVCLVITWLMMGCTPQQHDSVHLQVTDWNQSWVLPPKDGRANPGLAGAFSGFVGPWFVLAGGANFPDQMPWQGGKKHWYAELYAVCLSDTNPTWVVLEDFLPRPMAYGASIALDESLLCIGGADPDTCYQDVFEIKWSQGRFEIDTAWPSLPCPLSNATASRAGNLIFVAGGQSSMHPEQATHHVFQLDLSDREAGWQTVAPWPGDARGFAVSCAIQSQDSTCFYLLGGRNYQPDGTLEVLEDGFVYQVESRQWRKLQETFPVMAGTAFLHETGSVILLGGVPRLIPGSDTHPGFDNQVRVYDPKCDQLTVIGESPFPIAVTTSVTYRDGRFYIGSGEIKPGIRAPYLLSGKITTASGVRLKTVPVFEKGEGGYACFRIPALVQATNGDLLAFAEARKNGCSDTGDIDLVLKRSTDQGATWSPLSVVWDDGANVCGNPAPIVDRTSGRIVLVACWNLGEDTEREIMEGTSKDSRRVFVLHSEDDGRSWSQPQEITADVKCDNWGWYATGPCHGIQLLNGPHRGRMIVPANHSLLGSQAYRSQLIYSDDGGKHWKLGGVIEQAGGNESTVYELADGSVVQNMRNYNREAGKCRAYAVSHDGGEHLSPMGYIPELVEPVCQGSALMMTQEGRATNRVLFSNPATPDQRIRMTIKMSENGGLTWPVAQLVHVGPSAYSDLVQLSDTAVGLLYEYGKEHAYETIGFRYIPSINRLYRESGSAFRIIGENR